MNGIPVGDPSPWVVRWCPRALPGSSALDLACGRGRHVRLLRSLGYRVVAVDRDEEALRTATVDADVEALVADVESGPWPLVGRAFDVVVVTNYLWRPRMADILAAVAPRGLLVYETFLEGHERIGRPANPDFLLRRGELRDAVADGFETIAFEEGPDGDPVVAVRQRICARRRDDDAARSHSGPATGRLRTSE